MRILLATVVASAFALVAPAQAVRLEVGYAEGLPGDEVTIAVAFESEGTATAATQNDIGFDADAPIAATAALEPDCSVDPGLGKEASAFAYLPPGCMVGETCTGVRALIISFSNVDPIPDGIVYTCQVELAAAAAAAPHFLPCSEARVSTPDGIGFRAPCRDGEVLLPGGRPRTPRPPPPPTAPPTSTPTRTRVPTLGIEVAYVYAEPGDEVVVDVALRAAGFEVAGTQNDIGFPPEARILATAAGRPDCTVNPAINKPGTAFAFLPPGCPVADCTGVRALVLRLGPPEPIADGAVLYSCRVAVTGPPGASHLLDCRAAGASDPNGVALVTDCRDGAVLPPGGLGTEKPTRTLRPTATPIDDEVRTRRPTSTQRGTRTPLGFPTPTERADDGGGVNTPVLVGSDDDGCAIGAPHGGAWALLLFPALLLIVRRP